ncbi:MAG: hypothetical protein IPJ74_09370 [Saprospiraceae bacterium]|nr:hypothetical protein [Saprospiraceae bacterium]
MIYLAGRSQGWWGKKEEDAELPPHEDEAPGIPSSNIPSPVNTSALNVDKWLKTGSRGEEVKQLQRNLDSDIKLIFNLTGKKLNPVGSIDGIFGQKTKDALWNVKNVVEISLRRYSQIPLKFIDLV